MPSYLCILALLPALQATGQASILTHSSVTLSSDPVRGADSVSGVWAADSVSGVWGGVCYAGDKCIAHLAYCDTHQGLTGE